MSLLQFAIVGCVISLVAMLGGLVWLGARGELSGERLDPQDAADVVQRGWRGRPGWTWFTGFAAGMSFYGEKPTREIIELLLAGNFAEGLPWAVPALGVLGACFFFPLFVGAVTGMEPFLMWIMVAFFVVFGTAAAWPRGADEDDSADGGDE